MGPALASAVRECALAGSDAPGRAGFVQQGGAPLPRLVSLLDQPPVRQINMTLFLQSTAFSGQEVLAELSAECTLHQGLSRATLSAHTSDGDR